MAFLFSDVWLTILCRVRLELPLNSRLSILLVSIFLAFSIGCSQGTPTTSPAKPGSASATEVTMSDGLKFTDDTVGTGAEAQAGKTVSVHYTGWLLDGTKFDSSRDRNQPFSFPLGGGRVIKGWDEGVAGMKVGGKRTLVIPPNLGYGAQGAGGVIPGNATLKFEVELLDVK
jgi:FKBP-type peptidyl-prolyl cis-trans isomerase FkpA